ncbi:hypothetical protein ACKAV7_000157 [Fusarium commune]
MAGITINGNTINPAVVAGVPQTAKGTNFILIQSKEQDLSLEQKLELEDDFHVDIQEYVAKRTYLCRYEKEDLEVLRKLDYIKGVTIYLREFKSTNSLKSAVKNEDHQTEYKVDCVLHDKPNTDVEEMAKYIAQAAQVDLKELEITPTTIRLTVHQDRLPELVKLDSVNRIEEVHPVELLNHDARETLNVDEMILSTPYEGKGQTICVADSGFDQGKVMDDINIKVHPAFPDRVELLESFWSPDDYTDKIGHGTHVCASICGTGIYKDGNISIRGTAPGAKLIVQNMTKWDTEWKRWGIEVPGDLFTNLFEKPYDLGVRIHSNSWSTSWKKDQGQADYEQKATRLDQFVYEHQDFIVLVAAGNHGKEATKNTGHIGAASAAKNCITVGATGSKRLNNGERWRLNVDEGHRGIEQTAQFSSRGPTKPDKDGLGGRIKPDVVAPGVAILSAASRALASDSVARTRYGKSFDPDWLFMSGTSMSTPLVAGCVALLREALQEHGKQHPSAALVKALLVNGAENFSQAIAPGLGYDYEQGFGRVDVQRSIAAVRELAFIDGGNNLENTRFDVPALCQITEAERQWESTEIPVPRGRNRIVVTLAYPDVAGSLLQHDLNLIVQSAGTERHGNMGKGDGFDHTNNVEKVIWDNVPGSTFKVTVKVYNNTKPRETAPFAVTAIYNASIVVWDPYNSSIQRIVSIPGISHSGLEASDKRLSGTVIDSTNDVLSAVVQADEFFLSGGNDVSGDNFVVKVDLNTFAIKKINLTTTTKGQYGAFIDVDDGRSGDLYVNGGYPSSILHVDRSDRVSPFYVREPTTAPRPFGFGGVVRVGDNLIVSDNTNHQLVRLSLHSGNSSPVVIPQTNYHNFSVGGSLSLPHRYGGKVLLMAEDILAKNTIGVSVFSSMDGWKKAKFVGFIESIDRKLEPASVATSQTTAREIGDRIYSSVLFYDNKINPSMAGNRTDFALRDITDSVDSLLQANGFNM